MSFDPSDYTHAAVHESIGRYHIGVRMQTAGTALTEEEGRVCSWYCSKIHDEILNLRMTHDPQLIEAGETMFLELASLFDERIYVERIPNEYDSHPNRPWLIVTTSKGRIKIGWRKRVISIDWSGSDIKATAAALFPGEDVTKADQLIHAWSYEDAERYLNRLLAPKGESS